MTAPLSSSPTPPPTVLVIEDERRMRDLLADVLPEMGYRAVGVSTAEQGLHWLQRNTADVVMLDLNLPVMDGLSFLDRLREHQPDLPVIIMTGFGDLAAAQRAIRHRVADFLTKPTHLGQIEHALGRARQHLGPTSYPHRHAVFNPPPPPPAASSVTIPLPHTLTTAQQHLVTAALQRHNGNRTAAARELGISRRTLYNLLKKYQPSDSPPACPS